MEQPGTSDSLPLWKIRKRFADQVVAKAGIPATSEIANRIRNAFAEVRREDFLGAGPWTVLANGGYEPTPSADPACVYIDAAVVMAPDRRIYNGQPMLHALLIASAAPSVGDHIVHVGAGLGYYTAILAHMVGPTGYVTAIEYQADLAERAARNLESFTNVKIRHGDGGTVAFEEANLIYVNAGVTRPADTWLDRLAEGGRLMLPLTTNEGFNHSSPGPEMARRGGVFRVERHGEEFHARYVLPIFLIPSSRQRDAESELALHEALGKDKQQLMRVTRLYRDGAVPAERCWLRGQGWCLAYS
jgi:protein-L-isoaspartate(D-aspartate) O-methyltransferase